MTQTKKQKLVTPGYVILCFAYFAAQFGYSMTSSNITKYAKFVGVSDAILGVLPGLMSLAALFSRPVAGWISDHFDRKRMMVLTLISMAAVFVAYVFSTNVALLLLVRILHGIIFSIFSTVNLAFVADAVPRDQLTNGMGYYALMGNLSMAFAPAVGAKVIERWNYTVLFLGAAGLYTLSFLLVNFVKKNEANEQEKEAEAKLMGVSKEKKSWWKNLICMPAVPAAAISMCNALLSGAITGFLLLFAENRSVENAGLFFTLYAFSNLLARPFIMKMAEKVPREFFVYFCNSCLIMVILLTTIYLLNSRREEETLVYSEVVQLFEEEKVESFFIDTSGKLSWILKTEDFVLGLDDGKKRFVNEVTALGKAFALAVPNDAAMDVKDEISFFQAVKACLCKFDAKPGGHTNEEIETTIRQVIDSALVSEQVIDLFDAAGIKKPDISILSEEFLLGLKDMEHKNIALEVLRKLLNDEIQSRMKTNLVEGRTLMEMLDGSITRYHNKIISAAEVIDELINLSKHIVESDNAAQEMGLEPYEYAFYSAVADNESALELMGKEKLRELAVVLTETIRKNSTIDWTIKTTVRAKMKVAVKRLLRKYGYPPDMEQLATDTVLKQAELIAQELINEKN